MPEPEFDWSEIRGIQTPRIMWVPPAVSSHGAEVISFCRDHSLILDEWQQLIIDHSLGIRPDGKWASFEVGLNVPRQNGKGGVIEARELGGIFVFGERLIIHSAHEFSTAMEAFMRMEQLLEEGGLHKELKPKGGIQRAHGSEGFTFKTGQRIRYRTRTKGGGRGFTVDGALILDEAMILREEFTGALIPTLSGQSIEGNPQVWYTGSAVDQRVHEHGLVFSRVRHRGMSGADPSLAYFEWSAAIEREGRELLPGEVEADEVWDIGLIQQATPALGIRISLDHIEKEFRSLSGSFPVERLGIGDWCDPEDTPTVVDMDAWDELADPGSVIGKAPAWAFDVSEDRAWASIGAASWDDPSGHLEVIDRRRGTGWLARRLAEIQSANRLTEVLYAASGPAASLAPDLAKEGVRAKAVTESEHAQACGMFYDGVVQAGFRHLGDARLRVALKSAGQRRLGDSWAWSRRSSAVDISPLVAVSLAWWGARRKRVYRHGGFA